MVDKDDNIVTLEPRLKHFPIMMYAIVMGLSGLSIVYLKASHVLGFPQMIGKVLSWFDMALFGLITFIYVLKFIKYPQSVKNEFNHPVRVNFFAAFSISLLLLTIIFNELHMGVGKYFWYVGAIWQTFITFYCLSFWINKNMEVKHSNPAWLIPIVGNVIVPLGGVEFASQSVLMYFFVVGIFFWLVLFSILLNRVIFHNQLAQKFMPTLFILLAPPAVGMVSYIKMGHGFDVFAEGLYDLALFFSILLVFLFKNFLNIKFFISWWAFTFPVAAMSIASLVAFAKTGEMFYKVFSILSVAFTTIIILIVAFQTVRHMVKREICVME